MFTRTVLILSAVLIGGVISSAQETPRIWQGVYTEAQAERGKTAFESSCLRCHGADLAGNTAPALTGDRFHTTWGGGTIDTLFAKIRDTMPPFVGATLDNQIKLDIVAYILRANGFPSGSSELTVGSGDLAGAQILKQGESGVQNFALVQTVGCLTTGPNNTWMLTRTSDPVTTREDAPNEENLAAAAARALGTKTYRLIGVVPFNPQAHSGQKVEARGLIYTEPGNERINLTSLTATGAGCSE